MDKLIKLIDLKIKIQSEIIKLHDIEQYYSTDEFISNVNYLCEQAEKLIDSINEHFWILRYKFTDIERYKSILLEIDSILSEIDNIF